MADLRLVRSDDAPQIARLYAPYVRETPISFELEPPTEAAVGDRIERTLESHPWIVCEHGGEVVGYAYAAPHRTREAYRWSVDSSVYVDERYHRRGVARALYESLFAILQLQGYVTAHAGTALPNPASVGFHRAMGFEPVGVYRNVGYKDGWHDVQWWRRPLRQPVEEPTQPTSLGAVRSSEEWEDAITTGCSSLRLP